MNQLRMIVSEKVGSLSNFRNRSPKHKQTDLMKLLKGQSQ